MTNERCVYLQIVMSESSEHRIQMDTDTGKSHTCSQILVCHPEHDGPAEVGSKRQRPTVNAMSGRSGRQRHKVIVQLYRRQLVHDTIYCASEYVQCMLKTNAMQQHRSHVHADNQHAAHSS